jgi:hypothetical protein
MASLPQIWTAGLHIVAAVANAYVPTLNVERELTAVVSATTYSRTLA